MSRKNILIWGEFPPKTITGISISNQNIGAILEKHGFLVSNLEEYSWNKNILVKILHLIQQNLKVLVIAISNKIDIFYFTISLSVFGLFKVMVMILPFYIFSRKTKRIGHIHRGDIQQFVQSKKMNRKLLQFVLRRTDLVVVLSEQFKKDVEQLFHHSQLAVLHNTSSIEKVRIEKREYGRKFVCISNYIESKGIENLVECFNDQELKNLNLSVYGQVYDQSFYEKLEKKALANIKLNNALDHGQIGSVLEQADCLILPSWNEGQPIILLEAMSLGLPIISTNVGDIPQMLGRDYSFYAKPRDVASLENAILRFDKMDNKKGLSEYLYQRYRSNYSNEDYKKKVLEIFKPN